MGMIAEIHFRSLGASHTENSITNRMRSITLIIQIVDSGKRPQFYDNAIEGSRRLVLDFTCPETVAPSHLNKAVTGPGAVATDAENRKRVKYTSSMFVPEHAAIGYIYFLTV